MSVVHATYYCNDSEFPARVSLEKDKLCIHINEGQNQVFWYYEQIKKEAASPVFYYPGYPLQSLNILAGDPVMAGARTWLNLFDRWKGERRCA